MAQDIFCEYGDDFRPLDREALEMDRDCLAEAEEADMQADIDDSDSRLLLELMVEV